MGNQPCMVRVLVINSHWMEAVHVDVHVDRKAPSNFVPHSCCCWYRHFCTGWMSCVLSSVSTTPVQSEFSGWDSLAVRQARSLSQVPTHTITTCVNSEQNCVIFRHDCLHLTRPAAVGGMVQRRVVAE